MGKWSERLQRRRKETVRYIAGRIAHVCRNLPARTPGSEGERRAAEYMETILRNDCGCRTSVEHFHFHPDGFPGYLVFCLVLDCLCALLFRISPWLSLLFGSASMIIMVCEFVLFRPLVDPLFPGKTGTNITAVRPCKDTVRQRVFFTGHTDAAWEATISYYTNGTIFVAHSLISTFGVLVFCILSVASLLGAGPWVQAAAKAGLVFLLIWPGALLYMNRRRTVDGANDNLTGCFLSIALMKELEENRIDLMHTEVGVILTGAEEAGLRGAKAWSKAHHDDYRDVPTCIFTIDTIHHPQFLMAYERDMNGLVQNDRELMNLFIQSARELGIPCGESRIPFMGGSTDSAAFRQGGFRSVSIAGMDHHPENYYHTRRDTCDNLDVQGLENCYAVMVHTLEKMDDAVQHEPVHGLKL